MRKETGSSIIELAVSCIAITVITVVCVDLAVVVFGTSVHDRCCREATRAAAKGSSKTAATALARSALAASKTDGKFVAQPDFADTELIFNDFGGSPKPEEVPTVRLTTHSKVRLPASISCFDALLALKDGTFDSAITYVFPLTNIDTPIPSESP